MGLLCCRTGWLHSGKVVVIRLYAMAAFGGVKSAELGVGSSYSKRLPARGEEDRRVSGSVKGHGRCSETQRMSCLEFESSAHVILDLCVHARHKLK
jgi:hypothetical protein